MKTQDATGHKIGELKQIDGHIYKALVGAFTDKQGESYSQLRWYRAGGKESRKFKRGALENV